MKNVTQQLESLEDPVIRARALTNLYRCSAHEYCKSQSMAIKQAFLWFRSPEGLEYWKEVYNSLAAAEQAQMQTA